MELMTYVTCPTIRYHPAIIAQKAATMQLLAEGRVILGLGSGEELNEHVVGAAWPSVADRQAMLVEAIHIIRELHTGKLVDFTGDYFDVRSARVWDLPEHPVAIAVAVGGERGIKQFGPLTDHCIAVEPEAELITTWNGVATAPRIGEGARAIGQIPICWDHDEKTAIARAHDQFRWFARGWAVNADLPTTAGFAGASQFVRPEDVAKQIPCGPDLDAIVEAVGEYLDAGFTDVALVQIGGEHQDVFFDDCAQPLLKKLRARDTK